MTLAELKRLVARCEGPELELKRSTGNLAAGLRCARAFMNRDGGSVPPLVLTVLVAAVDPRQRDELLRLLGLNARMDFAKAILKPLVVSGWIEMTPPGRPRNGHRRCRTTPAGLVAPGRHRRERRDRP